jgi:two-component system chemotaxis response regulator CheY
MKIMIVEDSLAMRRIIRRTLRQAGFEGHDYVEAANGKIALDMIKEDAPDLVLADWNMPEMSGIDLLKALRADGINVKFGFITSESTDAMKEEAMGSGASFLLPKPFNADQMKNTLAGHIE